MGYYFHIYFDLYYSFSLRYDGRDSFSRRKNATTTMTPQCYTTGHFGSRINRNVVWGMNSFHQLYIITWQMFPWPPPQPCYHGLGLLWTDHKEEEPTCLMLLLSALFVCEIEYLIILVFFHRIGSVIEMLVYFLNMFICLHYALSIISI